MATSAGRGHGRARTPDDAAPTIVTSSAVAPMAIRRLRDDVEGMSRRTLLRRGIGLAVGLWLTETIAGTVGFLWPNLTSGFGGRVTVGDLSQVAQDPATRGPDGDLADGAPAYIEAARAFVVLIDPTMGFIPGDEPEGDGSQTNVRTLYQRCTHLGCKPNFCLANFWFECPCHGSRYDRLGIKVAALGPAPRGLDRFASSVDSTGILTIDTGHITLGPLPIALGQPGVIPPRSPSGCL